MSRRAASGRARKEAQKDQEEEEKKLLEAKQQQLADAEQKSKDTGDPEFNKFLSLCEEVLPKALEDTTDVKKQAWYDENLQEIRDMVSKNKGYLRRADGDTNGEDDTLDIEDAGGENPELPEERPDLKANRGDYALHYAAGANKAALIQYLIQTDANISVKNNWGATPLHRAVSSNSLQAVEMILKLCNSNKILEAKTILDQTPLHMACYSDSLEIASALLQAEKKTGSPCSQTRITDKMGNLPRGYAYKADMKEIMGGVSLMELKAKRMMEEKAKHMDA